MKVHLVPSKDFQNVLEISLYESEPRQRNKRLRFDKTQPPMRTENAFETKREGCLDLIQSSDAQQERAVRPIDQLTLAWMIRVGSRCWCLANTFFADGL